MGIEGIALIWLAAAALLGGVLGFFVPQMSDHYIAHREGKYQTAITQTDRPIWERAAYLFGGAALFGSAAYYFSPARALFVFIFAVLLLTVTDIDNRCRLIPNPFVLVLLGLGLGYRLLIEGLDMLSGVGFALGVAIVILLLASFLTRGKNAVGAGDIKLILVMAIAAGTPDFFIGLLAMAVCMILYSIVGMIFMRLTRYSFIPMGGCITIGFLASFFAMQLQDAAKWLYHL